ncbi:MAG: ribulokinase [Ancrocorticia sp.]|uniref:ribulokinase n=1 Tax=Ancrocorticia sp. TaxID=2593684 RepID=UPI003F915328
MTQSFAIGIDYGTESCRAVVLDLADGAVVASSVFEYPHGVVDRVFPPTGAELPQSWALQYPGDYTEGLVATVQAVLRESVVNPEDVRAFGIDATACTLIPTFADLTPLALDDAWNSNPYAWAKLWKDHSSQPQADRINQLGAERSEEFLNYDGGKLSSEWAFAKTLKLYEDSPEVFGAADKIYELGDWLVSSLVGNESRGAAVAGYKETYQGPIGGYPSADFLDSLAPGFSSVVTKLGHDFLVPGQEAGTLTSEWAERLGLSTHTVVACGNLDAHVAVLGAGISQPNEMLLVMGTSVCNLMLTENYGAVDGAAGIVYDGLIPGYWAYESGQAGVGDTFGWFTRNFVPEALSTEATERGISTYELLEERAAAMKPGESGLVCLDWFNGNRSTLQDADLSGLILGLTLGSRAEHVYRCLLEGSALGQKQIFDAYEAHGVHISRVVATGGLANNSPLLMQMMADVLERPIEVSASDQGPAVGAALHASIAAGSQRGGFDNFEQASTIAPGTARTYEPNPDNTAAFTPVWEMYNELYEEFGKERADRMHSLRRYADRIAAQ